MVDTSSESSLQQTESDKTDESSSQDAMTFRRQQNVSRDFADAFEINTETEQLEWYKAVRIAPWTNRFTKNGKVDEGMERMFWDQEAKSHQAILRSLTVFWMAFNILILLCDLHPLYYNDVKTPKVIKMNNFEDSRDVVLLLRLCIIFILLYAKVSRFFEGKDCSYLKSKWNLVSK